MDFQGLPMDKSAEIPPQSMPAILLTPTHDVTGSAESALVLHGDDSEVTGALERASYDYMMGDIKMNGASPTESVTSARSEFDAMFSASTERMHELEQLKRESIPRYGIWPTRLHAFCVMLTQNVGAIEYIHGPRISTRNGGFIYYIVLSLVICVTSLPMFYLETLLGRVTLRGGSAFLPLLGPIFRGFGYAMMLVTSMLVTYWLTDVAWIVVYAYFASFDPAQWDTCNPDYNSPNCFTEELERDCNYDQKQLYVYYNFSCMLASEYCHTSGYQSLNETHCLHKHGGPHPRWYIDHEDQDVNAAPGVNSHAFILAGDRVFAQRDFFEHFVRVQVDRHSTPKSQELSHKTFITAYALCWVGAMMVSSSILIASWAALFVSVLAPIVTMLILTRVVAMPGAATGVQSFFYSENFSLGWALHLGLWADFIGMTFWSSNTGMGVVSATASRDRYSTPSFAWSALLIFIGLAFGMVNSLLLFAVRGNLQTISPFMHSQIKSLNRNSRALVFVAFTSVAHMLPRPQLSGVLFFGSMALQMICASGLLHLSMALSLADSVPWLQRFPLCVVSFLVYLPSLGLAAMIMGGVYTNLRWSCSDIVVLEWIVVAAVFMLLVGLKSSTKPFLQEIKNIIGVNLLPWRNFLRLCWLVIGPFLLILNFMQDIAIYKPSPPVAVHHLWAPILSYMYLLSPAILILGGVYYAYRTTEFHELFATQPDLFQISAKPAPAKSRQLQTLSSSNRISTTVSGLSLRVRTRRSSPDEGAQWSGGSHNSRHRRRGSWDLEEVDGGIGLLFNSPVRVLRSERNDDGHSSEGEESGIEHL